MLRRWKQLFERGQDSGFSIAELTLVMLIVGILSAAAVPLYLGYVTDAKAAEAKVIAGSLWTALQTNAMVFCGTGAAVTGSYPRAGFTSSGETTPSRWAVSSGGTNTLTAARMRVRPRCTSWRTIPSLTPRKPAVVRPLQP